MKNIIHNFISLLVSVSLAIGLLLFSHDLHAGKANEDISRELAQEALARNPSLDELKHQAAALHHIAESSSKWQDPRLSVEFSNFPNDSFRTDRSAMTGVQIKLSQTFPFPGKNAKREEASHAFAASKDAETGELRTRLYAKVRSLYYELALARQLRNLVGSHIELLDNLTSTVNFKYEAGRADRQAVLRLQLRKEKLKDEIYEYDKREVELVSSINAALHRGIDTVVLTPLTIAIVENIESTDSLIKAAVKAKQLLKSHKLRAQAYELEAERYSYEKWPDITLWAGYRLRDDTLPGGGTDFITLGFSLPLSFDLSGTLASKKAAALENAISAEKSYLKDLDRLKAAIKTVGASLKRELRKTALYEKKLLPDAGTLLKSSLQSYRTDRSGFNSLYESELELLEIKRTIAKSRAGAAILQVRMDELSGVMSLSDNDKVKRRL